MTTNIREITLDQLGTVNGGCFTQTSNDSRDLLKLGLIDKVYSNADMTFEWKSSSAAVDEAWARVGVTCVSNFWDANEYYYDGYKIPREQALVIAKRAVIKGPIIAPIA